MATIDSKNLLVWVKAMSRGQALPLDASEIHESLEAAQAYAATAIAYEGQTVKAKLNGKYHEYLLQPSESGYVLEEVGKEGKQYVVIDDTLPTSGQEEGVLYINTTDSTGSIWTGFDWKTVFSDVDALDQRIDNVEGSLADKAPINNPVFTGTVKVGTDEVALKSYVDSLFANLENTTTAPGIVDSKNSIPKDYEAGMCFRVAEAGTYAGTKCEVGDLILVIKDYDAGSASDSDFMVLQANIDGAVTSKADLSLDGEIVVFDSVTGKVIKGAGVQIASLNDAIAKAHEHTNKTQLNTYDKTQAELLAAAKSEAQGLVNALDEQKADKGTTLADYGIQNAYNKSEVDSSLKTITDNLNTKMSSSDVDSKIEAKVGDIGANTVKQYVDKVIVAEESAHVYTIPYYSSDTDQVVQAQHDAEILQAVRDASLDEERVVFLKLSSGTILPATYQDTGRAITIIAVGYNESHFQYTVSVASNDVVTTTQVAAYDEEISASSYAGASSHAVATYVYDMLDTDGATVKDYVDEAVSGISDDIETAKQEALTEAKTYADDVSSNIYIVPMYTDTTSETQIKEAFDAMNADRAAGKAFTVYIRNSNNLLPASYHVTGQSINQVWAVEHDLAYDEYHYVECNTNGSVSGGSQELRVSTITSDIENPDVMPTCEAVIEYVNNYVAANTTNVIEF